jgi:hypothetical protein
VILWQFLHSEPEIELHAPAKTEIERGNELNARTINKDVTVQMVRYICCETDIAGRLGILDRVVLSVRKLIAELLRAIATSING